MGRSKTLLLCAIFLGIISCNQEETVLTKAQRLQCESQSDLIANQTTLREIEESYCTQILSNLAPKAPPGIKPQWSRENPYPALPDYFIYPDTNPMQINGKRLQSIAACMHKKCLKLTEVPESYCSLSGCKKNKGAFILNTFLNLAKTCTAEPYTTRQIAHNIRSSFAKKANEPLQWCSNESLQTTRDLRIMFGEKVDACRPGAHQCPNDYRCVEESFGYRCRPLTPIAAPEIPGIKFKSETTPQKAGSRCEFSKDCEEGLVCGHALGNFGICSKPCFTDTPCSAGSQCYQAPEHVSFCNPTCDPQKESTSTQDNTSVGTCVSAGSSGRWIQINANQLMAEAQKEQPNIKQVSEITTAILETILPRLAAAATCGNGVLEFPESCDYGSKNGEVERGTWCTQACTLAECGNNIIEPGESCECTLEYQDAFNANEEIRKLYQLPTTCPGRHALTDGSERALGFSCHSCGIIHARHMRETRQNPYFLPEFDPFNPPAKDEN